MWSILNFQFINSSHFQAHSYEVNLCDPGKIAQVGQQVINDIGKVDILVNNAGIATGARYWKLYKIFIFLCFSKNDIG